MFLVDAAHQRRGGREDFVDKDEDGFLGAELDALANNIDELPDGQIGGDEILLLVDGSDVGFLDLFTDDLRRASAGSSAGHDGADELTGMRSAYF